MPYTPPPATSVTYSFPTGGGNWRCPADVTSIEATGWGAGGSGGGGASTGGGGGGGGAIPSTLSIAVVPGTLYAGTPGAVAAGVLRNVAGNPGTDTTFGSGVLNPVPTWSGASGGAAGGATAAGGQSFKATGGTNSATGTALGTQGVAAGGYQAAPAVAGMRNVTGGFDGGAAGTTSTVSGGGGGGAGPAAVGTAGGNGSSTTGATSSAASAGSGAGSGGGGGGSTAGGASGNGGSGALTIVYVTAYPNVVTS